MSANARIIRIDPAFAAQPRGWMTEMARQYGITLRFETPLPDGVPAYKYENTGFPEVVLDDSLPDERLNFALAHEIAHIELGHTGEVEAQEEDEANRFASELLLPSEEFPSVASRPLRELKEYFPQASFEAIARRRLAYEPGVLTIADNGRITCRLVADGFAAPPKATPPELALIEQTYAEKEDLWELVEGFELEALYLDDGRGVVRVLLYVREG